MTKIRLTPEEVAACKIMGVSLHEYAWSKAKLQQMKEEYEAWLQTPAGVEYMDRRRVEIEEKEAEMKKVLVDARESCHKPLVDQTKETNQ